MAKTPDKPTGFTRRQPKAMKAEDFKKFTPRPKPGKPDGPPKGRHPEIQPATKRPLQGVYED